METDEELVCKCYLSLFTNKVHSIFKYYRRRPFGAWDRNFESCVLFQINKEMLNLVYLICLSLSSTPPKSACYDILFVETQARVQPIDIDNYSRSFKRFWSVKESQACFSSFFSRRGLMLFINLVKLGL